jgi:Xaa-Pro aminopeptidase
MAIICMTLWEPTMARDEQRVDWIRNGLSREGLDAVICSLPTHVLLISGYWPVVGTALALATRDGVVAIIAPEDERELAERGWADHLRLFQPGSLERITTAEQSVRQPLAALISTLGLSRARLGYEEAQAYEPVSYASMHLYGAAVPELLHYVPPQAQSAPASSLLQRLASLKTPLELSRVRTACRMVAEAFDYGAARLKPGVSETEAAALFRGRLSADWNPGETARAGGFVFCMSGPNSATAYGAYARSRQRLLQPHDLVLVHCNSYAGGHWTDVTRTYCLGRPDERQRAMYAAVAEARAAALAAIRPGARAAEVDHAARSVLRERGFGDAFKHATGHGVGFAAIDHDARPRLHPKSDDVLEAGMLFNVEPAIYIEDYGGIRHCDMVTITGQGPEVLTPFQGEMHELWRDV